MNPEAEGQSARIVIENDTERPRVVWVEPWGEDYTLLSHEKLEIIARNHVEQPWFQVVEFGHGCSVYLEGITNDYNVLQDGREIQCGHQRQAARDAELYLRK